jgi:hypothetical protein
MSTVITQIADSLQLDLTQDNSSNMIRGGRIRGGSTVTVNAHGHDVKLDLLVTDSIAFRLELQHVLVHVGTEDLWLSLTADARDRLVTLMVVDGSVLELVPALGANDAALYPNIQWSRIELFKFLSPAVKSVYIRPFSGDKWTTMGKGNTFATAYLESRKNERKIGSMR